MARFSVHSGREETTLHLRGRELDASDLLDARLAAKSMIPLSRSAASAARYRLLHATAADDCLLETTVETSAAHYDALLTIHFKYVRKAEAHTFALNTR